MSRYFTLVLENGARGAVTSKVWISALNFLCKGGQNVIVLWGIMESYGIPIC